ncbi:fungal-specific transcription factor domain-containing protein [Mycena vitilis]|nr:fungal-specific transcription factor domain-containing protein [Mycena vitilis]
MNASNPVECVHNKDGSLSKMRAHRGNISTLPKNKICPHPQCSARFTRSTHLTRHMKTHTNERRYKCQTCHSAQFTRSDLLARHRRSCDPTRPIRIRSCILCTESKVKCDRNDPCSRCKSRGRDCLYTVTPRNGSLPAPCVDNSPLAGLFTFEPSAADSEIDKSLPLDSLSEQLSIPADDSHSSALVSSHLSSAYDDCFQPLFNDVFSSSSFTTSPDEFPFFFPLVEELPLPSGAAAPWFQEMMVPQLSLEQSEREQPSNTLFRRELKGADLNHYVYLFFNAFSMQIPVVHSATFNLADKPSYLLKAIEACGALFVRTHHASTHIRESLIAARDGLAQAFIMSNPTEQLYLLIAVVLLQTLGLWHQKPEERATSSLYHSMVVAMIRRAGLISKNYTWTPGTTDSLETMWRKWAIYETTKRALLMSYLQDSCLPIYFGLPASYLPGEFTLQLPCEQALWEAGSAKEWFSILQEPSTLVPSHQRLSGPDLCATFASMNDDVQFTPAFLPSTAHFVLIHAILRDLFVACSQSMASDPPRAPTRAIISAQCALHNWLQSWTLYHTHRPDTTSFFKNGECFSRHLETTRMLTCISSVLPFYWLGQVAILAHQEGLPPFNSTSNETGEVRFKMVKRWFRRIHEFLEKGDEESTLFWDELMKIRLQTWQLEYEAEGGVDDQDGLLAFFP